MQLNLNDLVDEFLRLERYTEESKAFESLAAVPNLTEEDINLERDWQQFIAYKFNHAGIHEGLLDAMRDGYMLLAEKLAALVEEARHAREAVPEQQPDEE
jgi:hypothetical protein